MRIHWSDMCLNENQKFIKSVTVTLFVTSLLEISSNYDSTALV